MDTIWKISGSASRLADDSLRFERRAIDRWPFQGVATAVRLSSDQFGITHELHMVDCSSDGLGAISQTVIEPGTTISIVFSSPGCATKRGTVLRCTPCGHGYRIAIQFEARLAA